MANLQLLVAKMQLVKFEELYTKVQLLLMAKVKSVVWTAFVSFLRFLLDTWLFPFSRAQFLSYEFLLAALEAAQIENYSMMNHHAILILYPFLK